MIRALVGIVLTGLLLTMATPGHAKYAAIVVDAETGDVLHAANADDRKHPASLTKMMTLYLLFDALRENRVSLDTRMAVSQYAANQTPTRLGLRPGSTITVRAAIPALAIRSANDVAAVVAEHLAGSEAAFARRMTEKGRQLGMTSTTFRNASGLPNAAQLSSARDMAVLAVALMRDHPGQYAVFARNSFQYGGRTVSGHNRLLASYQGADGLKTGYIRASGFNLASSAVRDGRRVVAVVFGGQTAASRDAHMVDLLDAGFATLARRGIVRVSAGTTSRINMRPGAPLAVSLQGTPHDKGFQRQVAQTVASQVRPVAAGGASTAAAAAAAPPPPSPPAGTVVGVGDTSAAVVAGSWAIQVGAFGDRSAADNVARAARGQLSSAPAGAIAMVTEARLASGKTVYRARVTGFDRNSANQACASLKARASDCIVVGGF